MAEFIWRENDEVDHAWQTQVECNLRLDDMEALFQGDVVMSSWMEHHFSGKEFRVIVQSRPTGLSERDRDSLVKPFGGGRRIIV